MFSQTTPIREEEVLRNLQPQSDLSAQKQALHFIESIKNAPDSWEKCIAALTESCERSDEFHFFCLQVIEHFVSNQYQSTIDEQQKVRDFLSFWIRKQCEPNSRAQSLYIGNKYAQIFSVVFVRDYPAQWPKFFDDLVKTLNFGSGAVDCFLRVLLAINEEINSQDLYFDLKQVERNNRIKTAMRETSIKLLTDSWYQILNVYLASDKKLTVLCLKVIAAYVSWIDMQLIADDRFIQSLATAMSIKELRESAAECLLEVARKSMHPTTKIQLIEVILSAMRPSSVLSDIEDQTDIICKMATAANAIGLNLFEDLAKIQKGETPEEAKSILDGIENTILPVVLMCLSHENQNAVMAITPFTREYILMLKTKEALTRNELDHAQNILITVVRKMQYSMSYNFDLDGINEDEFDKYRQLLNVVFGNLVGLNRDLVLDFTLEYVTSSLLNWRNTSFHKVEVALALMYYIGDVVPKTQHLGWFKNEPAPVTQMQNMMRTLISSGVSEHPHPQVNQQYIKTVVRYGMYFSVEPQHLPLLLESLFDHRGLKSTNSKVRHCCARQFLNFIEIFPCYFLHQYVIETLRVLKDVIQLSFPARVTDNAVDVSANQKSQLDLYEATGIIIATSSYRPDQKVEAFKELLSSPYTEFSSTLTKLSSETDLKRYEALENDLVHLIAITKQASNVFTSYHQLVANKCEDIFMHGLQLFIPCLLLPRASAGVKISICQILHRMVVCLEDKVLPFITQATEALLKDSDVTTIEEYVQLLVQIISKFKTDSVPFLQNSLKSIVLSIFFILESPMEVNDEHMRRDKVTLYRCYFSLIYTIASQNAIIDALVAEDAPFMMNVKQSVVQGATELNDALAQRNCFSILRHFVTQQVDNNDPQFTNFLYRHVVPACFMTPLKPDFDLNDATFKLVLWEVAACMRAIYDKRGEELINFLLNDFETTSVPREIMTKYCLALVTDLRQFKIKLNQFVIDARK